MIIPINIQVTCLRNSKKNLSFIMILTVKNIIKDKFLALNYNLKNYHYENSDLKKNN